MPLFNRPPAIGISSTQTSSHPLVTDFVIEHIGRGVREYDKPVFGPGSVVQGAVKFAFKENLRPTSLKLRFTGSQILHPPESTSPHISPIFSIEEILWDRSTPNFHPLLSRSFTCGTPEDKNGKTKPQLGDGESSSKTPIGYVHTFLFAVKLPQHNYPPSLEKNDPCARCVENKYQFKAFVSVEGQTSENDAIESLPLEITFLPRIEPCRGSLSSFEQKQAASREEWVILPDLAQGKLEITGPSYTTFSKELELKLHIVCRHSSNQSAMPGRAKVYLIEVHRIRFLNGGIAREAEHILSRENLHLPSALIRPYAESVVPIILRIPKSTDRSSFNAMPSINIGLFECQYLVRIEVPIIKAKLGVLGDAKTLVVETGIFIGNHEPLSRQINSKPTSSSSKLSIPTLVVNEGKDELDLDVKYVTSSETSSPSRLGRDPLSLTAYSDGAGGGVSLNGNLQHVRTLSLSSVKEESEGDSDLGEFLKEWTGKEEAPRFLKGGELDGGEDMY